MTEATAEAITAAPGAPAFRDFDEITAAPPACSFRLGGRDWSVRAAEDIPFSLIRQMVSDVNKGDVLVVVEPFFVSTLVPDQVDDFVAMLNDPKGTLTIGRVTALIEFVMEQVLGRPTEPPSASSAGRRSTGRTSKAGSSSPGTRRRVG